ncbi:hypothetical protein [uncultured Fibrobacter sp.]|jgi:hypothetical protein|uniref:hypothetical protein n=1 Tax=uncultured Fibrobacter sp. TaxID=261512 RepID=UPI002622054E|nr:hypothetical protein [uncultured Fibrobacter sp.]
MYKHIVLSILSLAFVGMPLAQTTSTSATVAAQPSAPAATVQSSPSTAPQPANLAKVESQVVSTPRGATATLDEMIQAKLDSMNRVQAPTGPRNGDSVAKVQADSVRKLIQDGKYVQRIRYDKKNFDHWNIDTVLQKKMKEQVFGAWRTPIIAHGHAFRDAELRFGANDTLVGITRTYSDSGRYQMTGEYTFKARYRFENETSLISREVFKDRQVVRWDYITFDIIKDSLLYNLNKLEFRDLNDNWLNALQGFDNIPAEVYLRDPKGTAEMKQELEKNKKKK